MGFSECFHSEHVIFEFQDSKGGIVFKVVRDRGGSTCLRKKFGAISLCQVGFSSAYVWVGISFESAVSWPSLKCTMEEVSLAGRSESDGLVHQHRQTPPGE